MGRVGCLLRDQLAGNSRYIHREWLAYTGRGIGPSSSPGGVLVPTTQSFSISNFSRLEFGQNLTGIVYGTSDCFSNFAR